MLVVGGQAGAGAGFNVVPGSAWFSVDRRFNPEEELDEELERLTGMIEDAAAAAGAEVEIEVLQAQPSGQHGPGPPRRAGARAAASRPSKAPRRPSSSAPACSTRAGTRSSGSRPSRTAAGRLEVAHGPDEYIEEAAMRRCAAVYALFAARV